MIPVSENSTNFALPNMQSNMSPLGSPQGRRQSSSNNDSSSASTTGDTNMTSPVERSSFSSTTSHTGTSNGSAIGCGRMGCTGGILVMFPSSPSTTANCTIRANVALPSNANGLSSPNSSSSVSQVIAQRFCNCPSPAEPGTQSSRSGSGSSSNGAPRWGSTASPHCSMMEVDEPDTPRHSARHPSIHCMTPNDEEAQQQQPQLYIDTQMANLDFHGPHSPPTVVPMYKRRQSALCAIPGGAPQTNGPVSSHEHFLSIRNRANSNPHSQSLYAKSPVNCTFSSSFDGSINGSPLTIMNSPVSPSTNRVQRPLANFRRYHANSISNSNGVHSGGEPGISYPTQYRSSQNFVNLNRSAMMHNMHNNFRSMDSASANAMNHLANGVPTHASVDLSRTALLIREVG